MSKIQYLMEKRFSFVAWLLVVVAATTLKLANETSSSWSLHSQMSHEKSHKKKNRVGLYKNGITRSQCLTAKEFFGKKTLHIKQCPLESHFFCCYSFCQSFSGNPLTLQSSIMSHLTDKCKTLNNSIKLAKREINLMFFKTKIDSTKSLMNERRNHDCTSIIICFLLKGFLN